MTDGRNGSLWHGPVQRSSRMAETRRKLCPLEQLVSGSVRGQSLSLCRTYTIQERPTLVLWSDGSMRGEVVHKNPVQETAQSPFVAEVSSPGCVRDEISAKETH